MTNQPLTDAMFAIVKLAPMKSSEAKFGALAAGGDPDAFMRYYEACLRNSAMDEQIEKQGLISFRMLKSAIEAVYRLKA